MKPTKITLAFLSLALSTPALSNAYITTGLGTSIYDNSTQHDGFDDSLSYRLGVGYNVLDWLGVEASYNHFANAEQNIPDPLAPKGEF